MKKLAIILVIIVIAAAGAFAYFILPDILASSETHSEIRELSLSTNGIETFEIRSDIDEISIVGGSGGTVSVTAEIDINLPEERGTELLEKNLQLELTKRGSRASFAARYDGSFFDHFQGIENYVYITVQVSAGIDLDVYSERGDLYLGSLRNGIVLSESSGNVVAEDLQGMVKIINGNGDIRGNRITGDMEIYDSGGTIELMECKGSVFLEDEKGSVIVRNLSGDLEIIDKGDVIRLENVSGDVSIIGAGRGDVYAEEIGGDISINEK